MYPMKNAVRLEDQKNRIAMFAGYVNNFNGLNVKRNADVGRFKTGIISLILAAVLSMAMVCNGYAEVVNTKLNGEWDVGLIYGDVSYGPQISPDNSFVVYVADQDSDEVDELYSVPIGGGTATKLNDPMVVGGNVHYSFKISPDSNRVVYLADQDTDGVYELYSVPIEGGTVTKLNNPMVSGGNVCGYLPYGFVFPDDIRHNAFAISPDSSRVVYLADQDTDDVIELYSVPIEGGTVTKLNNPMVSGGNVYYYDLFSVYSGFVISPDSSRVVYLADQDTDGATELYSVPIGGGTATKLNDTLISYGEVYFFKISPNNSRVVYCADQDTENMKELYSVPIEGGNVTKLNAPMVSGGGIYNFFDFGMGTISFSVGFEISADSGYVVYVADQDTEYFAELYSVSIEGGTVTKLNDPLIDGRVYSERFEISADSSQVVYILCNFGDNDLFSVPIGGGTPTKLDENLPIIKYYSDINSYPFTLSADSSRVVYPLSDGLYSAPLGGGSVTKLNNTLISGGEIDDFKLSADSSRVVYLADQDTDDVYELYSVPIGGGAVTKLNAPMVSGGDVNDSQSYVLSADSSRVVYLADQDTDELFELYCVPIEDGAVTKLNPVLAIREGGSLSYRVSPDSSRVVYCADQDTDGVMDLFSVPIGGGTITKLNDPFLNEGVPHSSYYKISSDSSQVVYLTDQDPDHGNELYSVPIEGGAVSKLTEGRVLGGSDNCSFKISPDCSSVVYRAYQIIDSLGVVELYSVPIGGGTATKLNDTLISDGDVHDFYISPDNSRVVYLANQEVNDRYDLYSVPIEGGAVSKLSKDGVRLGYARSYFEISPDSSRVVYMEDSDELYSVPIEGGTVTRLSDPMDWGDITSFKISPDSSRVIYHADQDRFSINELYSVPIGGGTVTKLNGFIIGRRGVEYAIDYQISPDSNRVIFLADKETDFVNEIYSVPIGGGAITKLNGPMAMGGEVDDFVISADSSRVVYKADQQTDEFYELYSTPIGGGTVTQLNDTMVFGDFSLYSFEISLDSRSVVYTADQGSDNIYELFIVPINGGAVTKQNDTLPSGLRIPKFIISPDSSRVVYNTSFFTTNKTMDLYSSIISVPGDFNNDGCVDRADYFIMIADIRGPAPHDMAYDLNEDGMVNIADARYLARLFTNPRGAACD